MARFRGKASRGLNFWHREHRRLSSFVVRRFAAIEGNVAQVHHSTRASGFPAFF